MKRTILYGVNPVKEALKAGRPLQRLLVAAERKKDRELQAITYLAEQRGVEVRRVSRDALNREAPTGVHQGVIAVTGAREYASFDTILARPGRAAQTPLYLILDGVEDPRNLGAIVRTAEAAGVHGIVIPERRSAGLTESAAKAAAGALEYVPVVKVVNIVQAMEAFKESGIWVAGVEAGGDMLLWDADFAGPLALVLGGEGKGIRRLVKARCDYVVSMPQTGSIHSLNVSVAAGIVLYEVLRQRRGGG